jgi:type II secretory pathway pseudopilin PulG
MYVRDKKGFTYVEILVSLAILFFVFTFFMQLNKFNYKLRSQSDEENKMTMTAQGMLNAYRNLGKDKALSYAQGYTASISEDTNTGFTGLKKVTVTITPKIEGMANVSLISYCQTETQSQTLLYNAPVLSQNMTPIKWDGYAWGATTTSDAAWFDYNVPSAKWANVRLNDGSMFVWIPRYTYKITYTNSSDRSQGGTIDIKFSTDTTDNTSDGYMSHPAFNFGGTQLKGIWVGKFEASSDGMGKVQVKPAVASWTSINIDNAVTNCMNITTQRSLGVNADAHLIKNSEWGAVVYFSKAVGKIPYASDGFYTGGSNKDITIYTTNSSQSTTGNPYGIYDMSGGKNEMAAAVVENSYSSTFKTFSALDLKYKDIFHAGPLDTAEYNFTESEVETGMALNEISSDTDTVNGWDGNEAKFPYDTIPFFMRGESGISATSGVFAFDRFDGNSSALISFRPSIVVQ